MTKNSREGRVASINIIIIALFAATKMYVIFSIDIEGDISTRLHTCNFNTTIQNETNIIK